MLLSSKNEVCKFSCSLCRDRQSRDTDGLERLNSRQSRPNESFNGSLIEKHLASVESQGQLKASPSSAASEVLTKS